MIQTHGYTKGRVELVIGALRSGEALAKVVESREEFLFGQDVAVRVEGRHRTHLGPFSGGSCGHADRRGCVRCGHGVSDVCPSALTTVHYKVVKMGFWDEKQSLRTLWSERT